MEQHSIYIPIFLPLSKCWKSVTYHQRSQWCIQPTIHCGMSFHTSSSLIYYFNLVHFWHKFYARSCFSQHHWQLFASWKLLFIFSPVLTMAGAVWLYLSCRVMMKWSR